jgi:hypothetical protein
MNTKNLLLLILFVIVFGVGFVLGRSGIETPLNSVADNVADSIEENTPMNNNESTTKDTASESSNNAGIKVANNLTAGQRAMLESFGLNPDEITITPTMIACAEAKVGASRVTEIQNGATPSLLEGASLIACYK